MNSSHVSANTQAVLLLTGPLIVGRAGRSSEMLSTGEYNRLARALHDIEREPADLLGPEAGDILAEFRGLIDGERITRLLGRGFLLSQAIERWQSRSIWVVCREDDNYPERIKERLKAAAPPLFYGCGDADLLQSGGLAIVGSRNITDTLREYAEDVGRLVARAGKTVISGGARGIDQASMRGALRADGWVVGVLADSLERLVMARENRDLLMDGRLVLVSPYDPAAGFEVGRAMSRNKLIYAFADAALVVSSDYGSGGTWAGATEQLEKLRLVPVYVRSGGDLGEGLEGLLRKGALPWPDPSSPQEMVEILSFREYPAMDEPQQPELPFAIREGALVSPGTVENAGEQAKDSSAEPCVGGAVPEEMRNVREFLGAVQTPQTVDEIAAHLNVSRNQARKWVQCLVDEGVVQRTGRPFRFSLRRDVQKNMFDV